MKKYLCIIILLIETALFAQEKMRIAVSDFEAKDIPRNEAEKATELIRNELVNTGFYTLVERAQMNQILKEQGFQQSGCTDVSCAVEIGKLLSANKILVGSVMRIGNETVITGRIVDVEKGIAEFSEKETLKTGDSMITGVENFVAKLSARMGKEKESVKKTKAITKSVETHDGFFLRFLGGGVYLNTIEKDILGSDLRIYGTGGYFSLQIGGAPFNNLILYFETAAVVVPDADMKWSSYSGSRSYSELALSQYGVGLSYYFMPINIYLSLASIFVFAEIKVGDKKKTTEIGPGINVSLGKELWVSANWGLGIAFVAHYSKVKSDEGALGKKDVINTYFGVAFSATFN